MYSEAEVKKQRTESDNTEPCKNRVIAIANLAAAAGVLAALSELFIYAADRAEHQISKSDDKGVMQ